MTQTPDPFEFLKKLWGPMGLPMAGVVAPTLDPGEIDKRIAELKLVENWLNMNLGVLRMTIQGLEMQKATLAAMQNAMGQAQGAVETSAANQTALADAWWKALQQTIAAGQGEPEKK